MDAIREELLAQLENKISFTIPIFGGISVPASAVTTWGIMLFLVVLSLVLTRRMTAVPGRAQLAAETFVGFINGFVKNNLGEHWRPFAPFLGTLALYLGCANVSGMFGLTPPTKDLNVTAGLAILSVFVVYGASFRYHGLKGGLRKFAQPMPLLLPMNLLEVIIRPLSLCMRLFGNILGAYIIMELIKAVLPAVVPMVLGLYFDLFDGIIQTIVFVFLTTLFLKESLE